MRHLIVIALLLLSSCSSSNSSLITNSNIKVGVARSLDRKRELYGENSAMDRVLAMDLTPNEREALEFLYAYAPIADMNIDSTMLLGNVRATLARRESAVWRDSISNDMFLHYVLPMRVNNEPIDQFRAIYSDSLAARVGGLSMMQAALEVNRWCQERVIYGSSDARTSSPLQSVRTAFGRCGEESVFAVAALRAAGLPSRQVYAPRWSHSDDNHAWVEVFTGDGWHYLGACEPEPKLDRGWFSDVATRSMLMIAKVYGDYEGDEQVISRYPNYTEINVTKNYTPVKSIEIKVVDSDNRVVEGANVELRIFNYAELNVVASKLTDSNGLTSIDLGLGDIMVYASHGNMFGIERLAVNDMDRISVELKYREGDNIDLQFDFAPPAGSSGNGATVTDAEMAANRDCIAAAAAIRNSYEATFPDDLAIARFAEEVGIDCDDASYLIKSSRGNSKTIIDLLGSIKKENIDVVITLLKRMPLKDLRDITLSTISDAIISLELYDSVELNDMFIDYILNPRVALEPLKPCRVSFVELKGCDDIESIIELCGKIKIDDNQNLSANVVSPIDVMELGVADRASRDILFVALSRSKGIASRLDSQSSAAQYFDGKTQKWIDVDFEKSNSFDKGTISLKYNNYEVVNEPKYYTHFTLARLSGVELERVDMPRNINVDMGGGSSYQSLFSEPMSLREGNYLIVSGDRMASGEVLTQIKSFAIKAGKQSSVDLVIPDEQHNFNAIGNVNIDAEVLDVQSGEKCSLSALVDGSKGGDYSIVALIEPGAEPTNHALRGLKQIYSSLDSWKGEVIVALQSQNGWDSYNQNEFGKLPVSRYIIDSESAISSFVEQLDLPTSNLPLFVVVDKRGNCYFVSQGYQINLPDNLKRAISKLE